MLASIKQYNRLLSDCNLSCLRQISNTTVHYLLQARASLQLRTGARALHVVVIKKLKYKSSYPKR